MGTAVSLVSHVKSIEDAHPNVVAFYTQRSDEPTTGHFTFQRSKPAHATNYQTLGADLGVDHRRFTLPGKLQHAGHPVVPERSGIYRQEDGDAIVTDQPGVIACALGADCPAVLVLDPVLPAFAAIHCGWRPAAHSIVEHSIHTMVDRFGSDPVRLWAFVGPGARQCCYETGQDSVDTYSANAYEIARYTLPSTRSEDPGKFMFDLSAFVRDRVLALGVPEEQLEFNPGCTIHDERYASLRRYGKDDEQYSNMLTGIGLRSV